jgi:hypothetical protein
MDPNNDLCFRSHVLSGWLLSRTEHIAPVPAGRSVILLLVFVSAVILGFSFFEIHDQYFYSLLDM